MKNKEIKSLVVRFGKGLDYFQLTFGAKAGRRQELSLGECLAMADSDPAFLWNVATSEALGGRPLPPFVCSSAALRTNSYYLCPDHPDVIPSAESVLLVFDFHPKLALQDKQDLVLRAMNM